jgi:hypothetical protein
MGVSGQLHASATLYPRRKDPLYQLDRVSELVWTKRLGKKILYLYRKSNLGRPVVQSVVRHYTDWATPTLKYFGVVSVDTVSRGNLVSIVIRLRAGRPGDQGSIPGEVEWIFPVVSVSRPVLGTTQPPVQWVPAVLSAGLKRGRGVTLTTHPHLVSRSRMSRSYTPLLPSVSWRVVEYL